MKIQEIYNQYRIPAQLQLHMFRVAAVAALICEHSKIVVDSKSVITAGLLHDMGNIIKFNLDLFPKFLEPQGREYWETVKADYITKYGSDEHQATYKITKEVGVSPSVMNLIAAVGFSEVVESVNNPNLETKIVAYADKRVGPNGVQSLLDRIFGAKQRFAANKPNKGKDEELFNLRVAKFQELETQIFARCNCQPGAINDKTIAPWISKLADYEIETTTI